MSIPTYGNKVLACRYCTLDIHGKPVSHSWLDLYQTASPGDEEIILNTTEEINWEVGDRIVIAPSGFNFREDEECGIKSKSKDAGGRPKLQLDCKLQFEHYAADQTYGSQTVSMRAEVGLLSRSVLI